MRSKPLAFWIACTLCVEWTRLSGTVKGINLKDQTLTIQNKEGDLIVVPVDYQIKVVNKHGELIDLKHLELDERVTLTKTPMEKPKEDTDGLVPPETPARRGF